MISASIRKASLWASLGSPKAAFGLLASPKFAVRGMASVRLGASAAPMRGL